MKEFGGILYTQERWKAFHKILHQTPAAKVKSFGRRFKVGAYTVNSVKSRNQRLPKVKIFQVGMKSKDHSRGQFKPLLKKYTGTHLFIQAHLAYLCFWEKYGKSIMWFWLALLFHVSVLHLHIILLLLKSRTMKLNWNMARSVKEKSHHMSSNIWQTWAWSSFINMCA